MLCRALRERGHDVLLVSFKRQYPQRLFPGRSDKDPSQEPITAEDAQYLIDSLNPVTWLTTFCRIRRFRPDGVVLQWWTTFWAPAWLTLGLLTRLVLHRALIFVCHNVLPHEARWWDSRLARFVLGWGTDFIVQSHQEMDRLLALLPKADVDIVPHPVYDMFADQKVSRGKARKQLGLPDEPPVLLFFGIVREYKGLADILAALPTIQAQVGRVMLVVAGEVWEDKHKYTEMIDQLDIGDSVIIEDRYIPNEQVPLYFSAADVLVAPYRRATGSGVVQMAVGCGCPVITTSGGDPARIATEEGAGLVTQPRDSLSLAECIIQYLQRKATGFYNKAVTQRRDPTRWEVLVAAIEDATAQCESPSS
jgi:glycosyltransferase involved in cell wall biosynthesis